MSFATWAPRAVELGAYLHIPFCTQRCGYCSFNTAPDAPGAVARFVPALLGEIGLAATAPWAAAVHLKSVFLGGGTPSLLPPEAMAAILDRLRAHFPLEPSAEITVECNPESVSVERLAGYRHAGVTRISLGVQSLDDRILPTLDRLHTAAQAREAFDAARAAGFSDVSADLIYGLPGLDLPTWEATVKGVLGWQPDHLSAYALTLGGGRLRALRSLELCPPRPSLRAQPDLLARRGVPGLRARGLRLPRRRALRQRQARRSLGGHDRGRPSPGGLPRDLDAAPAHGGAAHARSQDARGRARPVDGGARGRRWRPPPRSARGVDGARALRGGGRSGAAHRAGLSPLRRPLHGAPVTM